jgi:hypothetical protein
VRHGVDGIAGTEPVERKNTSDRSDC